MKIWKPIVAYLVAFLIQGSLVNVVTIANQTPNLLLALTIAIAYLHEEKPYALIFGAGFGLLLDLCFSTYVGPTGIMLAIVACIIYLVDMVAPKENVIFFLVTGACAVTLFYLGDWILIKLAGNPAGLLVMIKELPITMILTLAVCLVIYIVLLRSLINKAKKKTYAR